MTTSIAVTFRAKKGREKEFNTFLNNPENGRLMAKLLGANRNTLFLGDGVMVRVIEYPAGSNLKSLDKLAQENPEIAALLRKFGPIIENGFDIDVPGSLESFEKRITLSLAYDVTVD